MESEKTPLFTKGRVVKKESLDSAAHFPREFVNLVYESYCDGIMYGFDITYKEESLLVSAGAIKYMGEVILLKGETISFSQYEKPVCVKLSIKEAEETEDFRWIPVELKVDSNFLIEENERELGRFCLAKGAKLRKEYQGVEDFKTAYNTLDLTNVLYAGYKKPTMSPMLLKEFSKELFLSGTENSLDYHFGFLCMNYSVIERDSILWYLSKRLQEPFQERTNEEIYESLLRILSHKQTNMESRKMGNRRGPNIL